MHLTLQHFKTTILAAGLALVAAAAHAAPPAPAATGGSSHPWLSAPLRSQPPANYFTNLQDGDSIETPFVLRFGLSRYGVAPIVQPVPGTGHHHLLVNRELPLDFTKPLPFNDQYIHFGKGQMETVLTFKPGTYKLRLLLADHRHIPYFVTSKPLTITVTRFNDNIDPQLLVKKGVELLSPKAGETVKAPFHLQFHASGLNVGHADIKDAGVGHFRVVAERRGEPLERVDFTAGVTEAWLKPPPGDYKLRLELVANADGSVMATSEAVAVKVAR